MGAGFELLWWLKRWGPMGKRETTGGGTGQESTAKGGWEGGTEREQERARAGVGKELLLRASTVACLWICLMKRDAQCCMGGSTACSYCTAWTTGTHGTGNQRFCAAIIAIADVWITQQDHKSIGFHAAHAMHAEALISLGV